MDAPARPARKTRYGGDTLPAPLVSRGRLLREHGEACWRASHYVGTRGMSGAGEMILQESRGRVARQLCQTWGAQNVLPHMQRVFNVLRLIERREIA